MGTGALCNVAYDVLDLLGQLANMIMDCHHLVQGPSAPGKFASFNPMMGKGIVWDSMVCMLLSE